MLFSAMQKQNRSISTLIPGRIVTTVKTEHAIRSHCRLEMSGRNANPNRPPLPKPVVAHNFWCILAIIPRAFAEIWAAHSALAKGSSSQLMPASRATANQGEAAWPQIRSDWQHQAA
jgi:hypothetical protein